MEIVKRCCTCGDRKPLNEFHKNCREPDGRHRMCKVCRKKYSPLRPVKQKLIDYDKRDLMSRPIEHLMELVPIKILAEIWGISEGEAWEIKEHPWYNRIDWMHDRYAGEPYLNILKRRQLREYVENSYELLKG